MKKTRWVALIAVLGLALGSFALFAPTSEAKFGGSCTWAIQQYSIAQSNYWGCALVYGPTPPNDSSHPCWNQFGTMLHFERLVLASCEFTEAP